MEKGAAIPQGTADTEVEAVVEAVVEAEEEAEVEAEVEASTKLVTAEDMEVALVAVTEADIAAVMKAAVGL